MNSEQSQDDTDEEEGGDGTSDYRPYFPPIARTTIQLCTSMKDIEGSPFFLALAKSMTPFAEPDCDPSSSQTRVAQKKDRW